MVDGFARVARKERMNTQRKLVMPEQPKEFKEIYKLPHDDTNEDGQHWNFQDTQELVNISGVNPELLGVPERKE